MTTTKEYIEKIKKTEGWKLLEEALLKGKSTEHIKVDTKSLEEKAGDRFLTQMSDKKKIKSLRLE
jgi:hypothetical protein